MKLGRKTAGGWRAIGGALVLMLGTVLGPGVARGDERPYPERLAALQRDLSAQPTNAVVLFELGRLCHWQGTLGDSAAVKLADQYLRRLLQTHPTNAFGRALLGSTITLQARDAFLPTTKLKLVKQGLAEMDAAVAAAPEDHNVRFTRASNNLFLPPMLKRQGIVRSDFAWLTEQTVRHPEKYPEDFRQYVALYHGMALRKFGEQDDARRRWEEGLRIAAQSAVAGLIRAEIERKAD